jgi:hypothetical protein
VLEPVIQFSLVFLLSPLCTLIGEMLFGDVGARISQLWTLRPIAGFGLRSVRQIRKELSALPHSEWLHLDYWLYITISIVATFIALVLLFFWLTGLVW